MPSKSKKPEPAIAVGDEKPPDDVPVYWADYFRTAARQLREMDELIRAQEQHAAPQVASPVLPAWSTKLKLSMTAVTEAVNAARVARSPRQHTPDGVVGGDEKRMSSLEALLFEMEVEGEDIEHEFWQLAAWGGSWEKQAISAVKAGDDALARDALRLRRECAVSLASLFREVMLSRRICGEYRALLEELRQSR